MSKLLQEYNPLIEQMLLQAASDDAYIVARWHSRDYYAAVRRNHTLDETRVSQNAGLGLYVFTKNGHVAFGSTNELTSQSVTDLYTGLLAAARTNEQLGIAKAQEIYELAMQPNLGEDRLHYQHRELLDYEIRQLPQMMEQIDDRITGLNPDASITMSMDIEQDLWRIVRSDGTDVDFSLPKVRLRTVIVTVRTEHGVAQTYFRLAANTVEELVETIAENEPHFHEAVQELADQITAQSVEPGSPPVLLDAELVGMIAHEALGHPAESDIIASGGSTLGDKDDRFKAGLKVAESGINVTDHEADLKHGFHPYGAFGNVRQEVKIVKDGRLHESISDIFSAGRAGVENKNCERSEGYWAPAIPRMSNTYVHIDNHKPMAEPNGRTQAEIAQSTLLEDGVFDTHPTVLFIRQMRGGQVNPASGTFMFGTAFVYELTADTITPKKPVSLSGDALSALKSISFAAGEVNTSDFGYCGKSSQTAHVNSGGNAFVFLAPNEKITVA